MPPAPRRSTIWKGPRTAPGGRQRPSGASSEARPPNPGDTATPPPGESCCTDRKATQGGRQASPTVKLFSINGLGHWAIRPRGKKTSDALDAASLYCQRRREPNAAGWPRPRSPVQRALAFHRGSPEDREKSRESIALSAAQRWLSTAGRAVEFGLAIQTA